MGNNAGSIAGCVIGSGSSVLGLGAVAGGCTPLLVIPPAFAACIAGLGIGGLVGGALGAQACKDAVMNGRKKRYYGGRSNFLEFDALDRNLDGFLTVEDMPNYVPNGNLQNVIVSLMTYMHVIDINRDGRISSQELANFRDTSATDQGALELIFRGMDRNADGRLTPDEMVQETSVCSAMGQKPDAYTGYTESMKHLDKQRKGYVTIQDMKSFYSTQPKESGQPGLWKYYVTTPQVSPSRKTFYQNISPPKIPQFPTQWRG